MIDHDLADELRAKGLSEDTIKIAMELYWLIKSMPPDQQKYTIGAIQQKYGPKLRLIK